MQDSAGAQREVNACALFVMIGAEPCSAWLRGTIALDARGFVMTGSELPVDDPAKPRSAFETSERGVFAVGDVRSGSIKRVASAVGEGSVVVADVHRYLETTPVTQ